MPWPRVVFETELCDGTEQDITDGGAHVTFGFLCGLGMDKLSPQLLHPRGSHYGIGYGGAVKLYTIDIISREINVIANLVGTYNDLVQLMALNAAGKVEPRAKVYPLDATFDVMYDLGNGKLAGTRGILVP
ncbi:MAG: hypothetical protein HLX51_14895 [Micrococcaceae bacterium]|nr:hypothetical protein [Micrococcaceae bacterium]